MASIKYNNYKELENALNNKEIIFNCKDIVVSQIQ
jgi:hypothetical protein